MEKVYVQAVVELLSSGSDIETVLSNLRIVMAKRGHDKALPNVLRSVVRALYAADVAVTPTIVVAKASDEAVLVAQIKTALTTLGADTHRATVTVDDTIIGGLIATYKYRQIDQSYRTKLHRLYTEIVTN